MGDTDRTPDGGFSAGYMGAGSPNIRKVAAYIYQTLLSMASTQLGVPVASLTVKNGVVSGGGKSVTYGQLVAGQSSTSRSRSPATCRASSASPCSATRR